MTALDDISRWQAWATENRDYAGDVTVADSPDVSFWFLDEHRSAAKFFHRFADGGDGSLICLWSEDGVFESAPVVFLGHEGEIAYLADSPAQAIALIAASGYSMEQLVAYKQVGETNEALAAFVRDAFGISVPTEVTFDPQGSERFRAFMKNVTGNEYESY